MNTEVPSLPGDPERSEELELSPFAPPDPELSLDDEDEEESAEDEPEGPPPIFVDPTGRRRKILKPLGLSAAALCAAYLVVVAIGLAAGTDTPLTPWSGDLATHDSHPAVGVNGGRGAVAPGADLGRTAATPTARTSGPRPTTKPAASATPTTTAGTTTPPATAGTTAPATTATTPSTSATATPTATPTRSHGKSTHTPKP